MICAVIWDLEHTYWRRTRDLVKIFPFFEADTLTKIMFSHTLCLSAGAWSLEYHSVAIDFSCLTQGEGQLRRENYLAD